MILGHAWPGDVLAEQEEVEVLVRYYYYYYYYYYRYYYYYHAWRGGERRQSKFVGIFRGHPYIYIYIYI